MRGLPAVLAALLLAGTTAHAHSEPFPKRDRLELRSDRITLTIDYVIAAPDEARALRDAFDRDRSGVLDADESSRLAAYLADQAAQFARVEVDGAALPWVRRSATPRLSLERLETRLVLEARWAGRRGACSFRIGIKIGGSPCPCSSSATAWRSSVGFARALRIRRASAHPRARAGGRR